MPTIQFHLAINQPDLGIVGPLVMPTKPLLLRPYLCPFPEIDIITSLKFEAGHLGW